MKKHEITSISDIIMTEYQLNFLLKGLRVGETNKTI